MTRHQENEIKIEDMPEKGSPLPEDAGFDEKIPEALPATEAEVAEAKKRGEHHEEVLQFYKNEELKKPQIIKGTEDEVARLYDSQEVGSEKPQEEEPVDVELEEAQKEVDDLRVRLDRKRKIMNSKSNLLPSIMSFGSYYIGQKIDELWDEESLKSAEQNLEYLKHTPENKRAKKENGWQKFWRNLNET